MKVKLSTHSQISSGDALLNRDEWTAGDIGLSPDVTHAIYYLKFNKIKTDWLKVAAKKFVRLQAATRSFSTCRGYIRSFNHLDEYLQTLESAFVSSNISRSHIIGLIQHLTTKGLSPMTRGITLVNLRVFHQVVLREGWLDWPDKPLIYSSDLSQDINKAPKYIDEYVINQLRTHLHDLPEWMQHFIVILMETGRRVSEVCSLSYDCLESDGDNDLLMRVSEKKLSRVRLIPVSKACIDAIRAQQALVSTETPSTYLFPSRTSSKSPTVSAPHINRALNRLANDKKIKDNNGVIWRFSSHQFRHTIGTKMINAGVPQVMVQHYLGHESPEMTARYAHIHDATMKKAFVDYQEKLIDIQGKEKPSDAQMNAKWLKQNIMSQSLPNGLCALPLTQKRCPHANACLTCAHFRTSKKHLDGHRAQLEATTKVIENAKKNGWQRIVEMNSDVACSLKSIIQTLDTVDEQ